ncbi:hypothetical protein F4558_002818 [Micromonospora profundi]|uniref:hypothetical protein n=1 Tax=Micromonospora profundi TaxID=1420889 RepID=UPI0014398A6E|nr:hypothetical protein [Micromonospora profundi]NJC12992.1 hypothetical protein [Micromonospora profundi]
MTRDQRSRSRRTERPTPLEHLTGVTGPIGATAALIAAVARLLTAAATLTVSR